MPLGLVGKVTREQLRNLLHGYSADGSQRLVQNAGRANRRSAFDLTWSVPKSVSALWSQASSTHRLLIEQCCEAAVRKSAQAFQRLCGVSRRGHDGIEVQEAKLAMALFRHETSRGLPGEIPDPNLHWHLLVPNIAVRPDGSTGAFDARKLFGKSMKMALGALFRAELSRQMLEIGLKSYRPRHSNREQLASWFELAGVPSLLIEEMSKRRREIESWMQKNGVEGAKHAERAALTTRHSKEAFSREKLFKSWEAIGLKHDFTQSVVDRLLDSDIEMRLDPQKELAEAVTRALARLTDHQARFSDTELIRFVAEESQCRGIGLDIVLAEVENLIANSPEIVRLGQDDKNTEVLTTYEMLQVEKHMFHSAQLLAKRNQHFIGEKKIDSGLSHIDSLREEQAKAIRHIIGGLDLVLVNGVAGSGKTFMLKVASEIWNQSGFQIVGTSLAAKAAKTLQDETGITSYHIHKLFHEIENDQVTLDEQSILVVDEAGMLGTRQFEKILQLVEMSNSKLVLVGDHGQLQAIAAGAPFRALAERVGCFEMNQITRQREGWARQAVYDIRDGQAESALAKFWHHGLLSISEDRDRAIHSLVKDWGSKIKNGESLRDNQIFVGTNLEVALINEACQSLLRENGKVGSEHLSVNGSRFYENDRVMITRNWNAINLRNGSMGSVSAIETETRSLQIQFDDGLKVWISVDEFSDLKLAYAISTHKGQGQTVENAYVLAGGFMTDREISYVQSSRARNETRLYVDRLNSGYELELLVSQMNRSRAKEMAHDRLRVIE